MRQEYEEKIKGLMPVELRQELEDTIASLKAQVRADWVTGDGFGSDAGGDDATHSGGLEIVPFLTFSASVPSRASSSSILSKALIVALLPVAFPYCQ